MTPCEQEGCAYEGVTGPDGTWCFVHSPPSVAPGPQGVCWEYQAGELPIRLSFSIKVF